MKKQIFITACSFKVPGIGSETSILEAMRDASFSAPFTKEQISKEQSTYIARIDFDKSSKHYPSRSSLKILRSDVIAAVISSGELLDQVGLSSEEMIDTPLYISNGACLDQLVEQIAELTTAYLPKGKDDTLAARNRRVYEASPPLFVLRALTNAAECFVSGKCGSKGDNTTFGSTSHSTHDALIEGIKRIESGKAEKAVVGAANGVGIFSALTFKNFFQKFENWKECEGAGFLLLETEESYKKGGRTPLVEITECKSSSTIPDLFDEKKPETPYQILNSVRPADISIFSGGITSENYEAELTAVNSYGKEHFSWYKKLGTLGTNSIIFNIATAIALIKDGPIREIDCLNQDPYKRESLVKINKIRGDHE